MAYWVVPLSVSSLPQIVGWYDPAQKGGCLRLAANSYLPAKGDPSVNLPGLRRGDLIVLENGRVTSVNGESPNGLEGRSDFAKLGAVHPNRPLTLETPKASSPRTAETQRVVDLICPFGFGQRALIVSPPKAGKINAGTAIHLGGGGDLSQPAPVRMREALFTNNIMSDDDVTKMHANVTAFFPMLKYPVP